MGLGPRTKGPDFQGIGCERRCPDDQLALDGIGLGVIRAEHFSPADYSPCVTHPRQLLPEPAREAEFVTIRTQTAALESDRSG
jgi:hypothetical protein